MFFQFLINGIITGSSYIPIACGLTLIYSVTGVFNFSHGIFYIIAGTVAYFFAESLKMNLGLSFLTASLITIILSIFFWICIFRPLQKRESSPTSLMIASMALLILLQNTWLLVSGNNKVTLKYEFLERNIEDLAPLIFSLGQLIIIPIAFFFLLVVETFLRFTNIGREMRAVSSNRILAEDQGLNLNLICIIAFAIGSFLSGISGYLDLLDTGVGVDPIRNFRIIIISTVACIVGGGHHLLSTALACIFIGILRGMSIWITTDNWGDAIMACLLIIFICIRSVGISGRKLWKEAI